MIGKEKEKKIKPIKQPVKPIRDHVSNTNQQTQTHRLMGLVKQSTQKTKIAISANLPNQTEEASISTIENVCTNLLESGNIQSFIDLFYISHKCMPNIMDVKNYFGYQLHIPDGITNPNQLTLQFFKHLGQTLSKAQIRPESLIDQKVASMNQYNSMAYNYEDKGDYITASYFYKKVIDIATSCKNKQFQLAAFLGLGKCYDQYGKKDEAIQILQTAFDEACILQNAEQRSQMTQIIGKQLIEIYLKKATQYEKINLQYGLQCYQSALRIAKKSGQLQNQSRICHRIGELYYEEGKFTQSVSYQQNYLQLLKKHLDNQYEKMSNQEMGGQRKDFAQEKMKLKSKQMEAYASLAKCYLKLKDIPKAQGHLISYHKMAKEAKAQNSVADSSYYLGKLFQQKGQKQKAINYYQSYFQAAKSQKPDRKDRRLVDKARVTFAIAKANKNMDKYISMFDQQDSLIKALDWKIKRIMK